MASKPRPVASKPSTSSGAVPARSAITAQRARTKRGLLHPKSATKKQVTTLKSMPPSEVPNLSDLDRDDRLRRELQEGQGRAPQDRQREHLSAATEDGVLQEDDPDVAGQRRAQSIDEQAADYPDWDHK